jgi:two-component system sensor histidine kinase UhpB
MYSSTIDSLLTQYNIEHELEKKIELLQQLVSEYYTLAQYDKAEEILKKIEQLGINDYKVIVKVNYTRGRIEKNIGNYLSSETLYFKGLKIAEKYNDSSLMAAGYNHLGNLLIPLNHYDEALNYLEKSKLIYQKIGEINKSAYPISNIAKIYDYQGKIDKAIKTYNYSKNIAQQYNDHFEVAQTLKRLANLNLKQGNIKACELYCDSVLSISNAFNYTHLIADIHEIKGMMLQKLKMYNESKKELLISLKIYEDLKFMPSVMYSNQKLAELYELLNDPINSNFHLKRFYELKDTIENADEKLNIQIQRYNFEKQQIKNELNDKIIEEKRNKNQRILLILMISVFVLCIMSIIFIFYKKQSSIKEKLEKEKLKSRISSDLHDEVGASLSNISVFVELLKKRLNKNESVEDILNNMGEISKEMTSKMSDIVWSLKLENMTIKNMLERLEQHYCSVLSHLNIKLLIKNDVPDADNDYNPEIIKEIYLIIKEAINNSIKYAHCSEIEIKIYNDLSGVNVKIADNGNGFNLVDNLNKGNGLRNMQNRAKQIKAKLEIDSIQNIGTTITISF